MSVAGKMPTDKAEYHAAMALAKHRKFSLGMSEAERRRLMAVLLQVHTIAMAAFDVLDADLVSEHDVLVMCQLPDYCNEFVNGLKAHAERKATA